MILLFTGLFLVKGIFDFAKEQIEVNRFHDIVKCPKLHAFSACLKRTMSCEDNNLNFRMSRFELCEEFNSIKVWAEMLTLVAARIKPMNKAC